jgi:hypothetical protein
MLFLSIFTFLPGLYDQWIFVVHYVGIVAEDVALNESDKKWLLNFSWKT